MASFWARKIQVVYTNVKQGHREFSGILKTSGLSKNVVQNFDKIQQNSPNLLL